jgi:hypothetical protein
LIALAVVCFLGTPCLCDARFVIFISGGGFFCLISFVFSAAHPNSFPVFAVPPLIVFAPKRRMSEGACLVFA